MASSARKQRRAALQASRPVADSMQNLHARLGIGAGSASDATTYGFNPITRERQKLEFIYRGTWIGGIAVDAFAEDMTRAGIDIDSTLEPGDSQKIIAALERLRVWQGLADAIRWARLYGGGGAILLIDGQDASTPLRIDTIGKGQFRGLYAVDRWMLQPALGEVVQMLGPDFGKPTYYTVTVNETPFSGKRVHHTRFLRFEGEPLPYSQRLTEHGWGMSVIERLYDRMIAFDSATQGASQLVFKAHLRTFKKKGLRDLLGAGGRAVEALARDIETVRKYQSSEGMTLIDADDTVEHFTQTFAGLSDMILQFGQQISGALQIPLVRLFGQSPSGMNSTGESDLRIYYDGIGSEQESKLRGPMTTIVSVASMSELGRPFPDDANFAFTPLWQMSDREKADIAASIGGAVIGAFEAGVISRAVAMRELRESSDVTGVFSNVTDEMIEDAEADESAPPAPGELGAIPPQPEGEPVDGDQEQEPLLVPAVQLPDARPPVGPIG